MSEKTLLLGRSGSGKTRFVLDLLAERIRTPGGRGKSILLVPTISQAGHIRRILLGRTFNLPGFFDESTFAFTGLAEQILGDRQIGEMLTGLSQDLMIQRALREIPRSVFDSISRHAGFRAAAVGFLKELKQNGRPFEQIDEELRVLSEERGGAVGSRLTAFRELFAAYERLKTAAERIDHEDLLREATVAVEEGAWDAKVGLFLVDGFQNFSEVERRLIFAIAARAGKTVLTLAFDPGLDGVEEHNFSVASETRDSLRARGFIERRLSGNYRARVPALAALEAGVFAPVEATLHPGGAIRALEGADPRDEADRVARTIVRLVAGDDGPARGYRDIVVVVRDVHTRRTLFADGFARHRIPLRIQGRESLPAHPLTRSAFALLRVAGVGLDREGVLGLFRSDHLDAISAPETDRLEYDLLEHGSPATAEEWVECVRVHSVGGAALLEQLVLAGSMDPTGGRALTEVVLGLFEDHLVPIWERTEEHPALVRAEAAAYSALLTAVRELGEDLEGADEVTDLRSFSERFAEAVKGCEYAVVDRRLNVVDLIDAREARQWEAPVVIVSGLMEGEFPKSPREDIFLADADRESVNRDGRLCLKEKLLERNEERYLFYVAMTRARERLYLTWPATDGGGRETLRSLFLDEVLRLIPAEEREAVISKRPLSRALPEPEEMVGPGDLTRMALSGLARPFRPETGEEAIPHRAAALSDLLLRSPGYERILATAARFRTPVRAGLSSPELVAALQPRSRGRSPTALETFARCAFKHFAGRTLRLQGPPRVASAGLDGIVLGNIAHLVLERLFTPVVGGGAPLPEDDALAVVFDQAFAELTRGLPMGLSEDRARRKLRGDLEKMLVHERERLRGGEYRPRYLEVPFGPRRKRKVVVRSEEGIEVPLKGTIDRVDVAPDGGAVVIDYKYSKKGFGGPLKADVEEGRHLQLPVYLLALEEALQLAPRGAWLYPILKGTPGGYRIEPGPTPKPSETIDAEDLAAMHDRTRRLVLEFDERILAGEITALPHADEECGRCDFGDVCRWKPFMREGEEE